MVHCFIFQTGERPLRDAGVALRSRERPPSRARTLNSTVFASGGSFRAGVVPGLSSSRRVFEVRTLCVLASTLRRPLRPRAMRRSVQEPP